MFRDERLWSWLHDQLLPERVLEALSTGRPLRALALGPDAGPEAHGLAILLLGLLEAAGIPTAVAPARAQVLGVDDSPSRVLRAARGRTSARSVQRCAARWLAGRVRPAGRSGGHWQVDEAVLALCRFEVGTPQEAARPDRGLLRGMDVVLGRHLLGRHRPDERPALVAQLAAGLDPGATLVLSPAEAELVGALPDLEPGGSLGVFRRVAQPAAGPERAPPLSAPAARSQVSAASRGAGPPSSPVRRPPPSLDGFPGRAVLVELLERAGSPEGAGAHAPDLLAGKLAAAALLLVQRRGRK